MSTPLSHSTSKRECQLPLTQKRECQFLFHTPHRRGNVNSPSPKRGNVNSPFTPHIEEGMSTPLSHTSHNWECLLPPLLTHNWECPPPFFTLRTELGMSTSLLEHSHISPSSTDGPSLSRYYWEAVDPPEGPGSLKVMDCLTLAFLDQHGYSYKTAAYHHFKIL